MFRKLHDPGEQAPVMTLTVDGQTVSAEPGESVAAVLLRLASPISRTTPVNGSPRTPYCMMGVCFECLANVDGVASVQTCLVQVRDGMRVERQHGRRVLAATVRDDAVAGAVASPGATAQGAPR
ncbi:D-hydroxyproline dehydrogenase subunit gamma [Paraburkholderia kururiensis]|jgi:predicted molibdopterin-dependent oxidoreductase YjgC